MVKPEHLERIHCRTEMGGQHHEHRQRDEVREHRHYRRRQDADLFGLQRERHLQRETEQHGPADGAQRTPRREHHQREGDPPDAVGGGGLVPRSTSREHVPRTAERHERSASDGVHPADARDRPALGVDRRRRVTSGT